MLSPQPEERIALPLEVSYNGLDEESEFNVSRLLFKVGTEGTTLVTVSSISSFSALSNLLKGMTCRYLTTIS